MKKHFLAMNSTHAISIRFLLVLTCLLGFSAGARAAAVGGSISGTVKDPSGAVVPKATITATDTDTGIKQVVRTNDAGVYSFPVLPVGHYDVDVVADGFKPYRRASIVLDVNSAILVDAALELGQSTEKPSPSRNPQYKRKRPAPNLGT